MNEEGILHLMIIWSKALYQKKYILNDLNSSFEVRNVFRVHWDSEKWLDNLTVFYSHSQKNLSKDSYSSLLKYKVAHCGQEDFLAIVFYDKSPCYQYHMTSEGRRLVNVNVFEKKEFYRKKTGGGHLIHCSNDDWETNKDLVVLFGCNTEDYLKKYTPSPIEISHNKNCIGVDGFDSIEQLFYLLNNTIEYCVLRNFECLPQNYTIEGHGDIDLLVAHKNYIVYLTQAEPITSLSYRVYHYILIDGEKVPFDFRFVGDDYYDVFWERNLLKTRSKFRCFYVPNKENLFYSLLYHAYVQKKEVKSDYLPKLKQCGNDVSICFEGDNRYSAITLLDSFFSRMGYEYVCPQDKTVYFDVEFLKKNSALLKKNGLLVKRLLCEIQGNIYESKVLKKECSYIKVGTQSLIEKECLFLKKIEKYKISPKILSSSNVTGQQFSFEMSSVHGNSFSEFFSNRNKCRFDVLKNVISGFVEILIILNREQIVHRDFIPSNILIHEDKRKLQISLIDFGWAISYSDLESCLCPKGLGEPFRPSEGWSDFYSVGCLLSDFNYFPYVKRVTDYLKNFSWEDYKNVQKMEKKMAKLILLSQCTFKDNILGLIYEEKHALGYVFRKFLGFCYPKIPKCVWNFGKKIFNKVMCL